MERTYIITRESNDLNTITKVLALVGYVVILSGFWKMVMKLTEDKEKGNKD